MLPRLIFLLIIFAAVVGAGPASAFSGRAEIDADATEMERELRVGQLPSTGVGHVFSGDAGDVIDIKLIQARPVGAGVLPFRTSDVRSRINPQAILASSTTSSGGGGSTPVTSCPDGTQFPTSSFTASIDLLLPDPATSGSCSFVTGGSSSPLRALNVTSFTTTSAALTTFNGWTASGSTVTVGLGSPFSNALTLTKGGVTFSFTLGVETNGIGGGQLIITGFTRL